MKYLVTSVAISGIVVGCGTEKETIDLNTETVEKLKYWYENKSFPETVEIALVREFGIYWSSFSTSSEFIASLKERVAIGGINGTTDHVIDEDIKNQIANLSYNSFSGDINAMVMGVAWS